MSVWLLAWWVLGGADAVYYNTSGKVGLERDSKVMALEATDAAQLDAWAMKEPGVKVEKIWGKLRLLSGPRDMRRLEKRLLASGLLARKLAAYREAGTHQLLIADRAVLAQLPVGLDLDEVQERVKNAAGMGDVEPFREQAGVWRILAPTPEHTVALARRLQESKVARWATPDFIHKKTRTFVPNDPLFQNQWHHENIGSTGAWEITQGDPTVIIAILDSGQDMGHPDIAAKLVSPRDAVMRDNDPTPDETDAHGTATAGLAGAIGNNALGIAGVCPNCSILPIRIMSETQFGSFSADSDGFYWAEDHGARVLSNSWGFQPGAGTPSNLNAAILSVTDEGTPDAPGPDAVVLFASGNDYHINGQQELPSHPQVLAVGATTYFDRRFSYSNYGPYLDLVAPSGSITIDIRGAAGYGSGDYMYDFGGTSAACPVAAGVVGLVLSVEQDAGSPRLTRGQVFSILASTSDQIGGVTYTDGFHPEYGRGRVNALRATQMADDPTNVCQPIAEVCDNAADDDCDFLIDTNDPSCVPDETTVGAACSVDFQCGAVGFCQLPPTYPGGYCTIGCDGECPDGSTCISSGFRSRCFVSCAASADCQTGPFAGRSGYDCMQRAEGRVCVPSCTVSGCPNATQACNTTTGLCEHNGPSPIGGECDESFDCSNNGQCLQEIYGGSELGWVTLPGGYCVNRCNGVNAIVCPEGTHCEDFGRRDYCVPTCMRNSDCRIGYSCYPNDDGTGTCWLACDGNEDCEGDEICNLDQMCGTLAPPLPEIRPEPEPICDCDLTTACDAACDCDPECGGEGWSCFSAAVPGDGAAVVFSFLLPLLRQRRRRR